MSEKKISAICTGQTGQLGIAKVAVPVEPARLFAVLHDTPGAFFLDSGMNEAGMGKKSYIGYSPKKIIVIDKKNDNPWAELENEYLAVASDEYSKEYPFVGGWVGYLSYDLGRSLEKVPDQTEDDVKLPLMNMGFYDWTLEVNVDSGEAFVLSINKENPQTFAEEKAREIEKFVANCSDDIREEKAKQVEVTSDFQKEEYLEILRKTIEYIYAGDIFQANISQRFQADLNVSPWRFYENLRKINPAPYAAYLNCGDFIIASSSPERFLKITDRTVETRPIKGTRPRGQNEQEDKALGDELMASEKDAAELAMIVDLERNDLGRSCKIGSVKVTEKRSLEKYPTVFHTVATVVGEIQDGLTVVDVIKNAFPGGSITGAPKIRAMEIIEELEKHRRGVYTGAIGYLSANKNVDLNIAIRTAVIKDEIIYFQAGGGITADSDPESEYQETLDKIYALINAVNS